MANRQFNPMFASLEKGAVVLSGTISLNASAAVTGFNILGAASVTKTGTGTYRITLRDRYVRLLGLHVDMSLGTLADRIVVPAPTTDVTAATPIVDLITKSGTGVAGADVGSASTIFVTLVLKNSSV
jgi:hypothetical protein